MNKLLDHLAERWGAGEELRAQQAVLAWGRAGLGSIARALYVERGILHLAVPNHVMAAELALLEGEIVGHLKTAAPKSGVVGLRIYVRPAQISGNTIPVPAPTAEDLRKARREMPKEVPRRLREKLAEVLAWARARDRAILAAGGGECGGCGVVFLGGGLLCPICAGADPSRTELDLNR